MKLQSKVLQVAAVCALAFTGVTATTSLPASADPTPVEERLYPTRVGSLQNPSANLVLNLQMFLESNNGGEVQSGTAVTLTTYSCGNLIKASTQTLDSDTPFAQVNFSPNGQLDASENSVNRRVGRSVEYTLTVTQPGYDAYTDSYSYDGYNVKRPSCEEINNPLVPKWSRKQASRTVVGRTVSVTPTTAPGATVTYEWKVAAYGRIVGKTVSTTRSLRLKSSWVGRKVGVVIKVKKPNYQQQSRTIAFPKVRRN